MLKNEYKILDNNLIIYVQRRNKDLFLVYFDSKDFDFIESLGTSIYVDYAKDTNNYYAKITKYLGTFNGKAKYKIFLLHRLILGITDRLIIVDHKNNDTLDNRHDNLRISVHNTNTKNRKSKNSNNRV